MTTRKSVDDGEEVQWVVRDREAMGSSWDGLG